MASDKSESTGYQQQTTATAFSQLKNLTACLTLLCGSSGLC
jgi:hypothetical protein